jgi:hypothetical protein
MDFQDAVAKADQILNQERSSPTVAYHLKPEALADERVQVAMILSRPQLLNAIRSKTPRDVQEDPNRWALKSTNYNLLCALLSQVDNSQKQFFVQHIMLRLSSSTNCGLAKTRTETDYLGLVSELPLVAEFSVRNGAAEALLSILGEASPSPGYLMMFNHLQDMITFNFTVFRDNDYVQLSRSVTNFLYITQQQLGQYQSNPAITKSWGGKAISLRSLFHGIMEVGDAILKECDEARYLYVKTSLESGLNLEINQDKATVDSYLRTLGFSTTLARSLEEAERLYQAAGNEFELKASMGHLRSFLEGLHDEAFPALHARFGGELPTRWGAGLKYFLNNNVLSKYEESYVASLYSLISDEGVHSLVAEREYARLFRNVVIEYSLLFLRKIEKLDLGLAAGQK